ncbi:MAG: glycosyltransferase family 4 protein [Gaiellaceae bacterium]
MTRATASRSASTPTAGRTPPPAIVRLACLPHLLRTNPYQRLLYEEMARFGFELAPNPQLKLGWLLRERGRVRVLHMHWPESYYRQPGSRLGGALSWLRLLLLTVRLATARALGYRIVWTVHQVHPHELSARRGERRRDLLAARSLARLSSLLIAHDEETAAAIRHELPGAAGRLAVVEHGSYEGVYTRGRARAAVREELGIAAGAFTFLCFGLVRAYKHLDLLLEAFRACDLPDAALVVAGMVVDEQAAVAARAAAAADSRIRLRLGFVPDEEVSELFEACDASVFARSDGGTSGALILALSLGCPAVAAATPAYERLIGGEAAGWLFEPGSAESLRAALERAASDPAAAQAKRREATARAELLSWPAIAERTASLIRATLEARAGSEPLPSSR